MPTYAIGQKWTAAEAENLLNATGKMIARGERTTASSATSGSTELGVLRIDNLQLTAGFVYAVSTGNMRFDLTVATDRAKAVIRYNSSGTATTSSTEIGRWESATVGDLNSGASVLAYIYPSTDVTAGSVLLSIVRATGTGTVTLLNDTGHGIQLFVTAYGEDPGDSGVDI